MIASVIIQFDRQPYEFLPLETLSGTFRLVDVALADVNRIEFSVLWFTEGKGDEDLGVHFFESMDGTKGLRAERFSSEEPSAPEVSTGNFVIPVPDDENARQTFRFSVRLPASPLSYYGKILKIYWCARVRLFPKNGREVKSERIFTVGKVPPVQVDLN